MTVSRARGPWPVSTSLVDLGEADPGGLVSTCFTKPAGRSPADRLAYLGPVGDSRQAGLKIRIVCPRPGVRRRNPWLKPSFDSA
jgi:hypothetical protein